MSSILDALKKVEQQKQTRRTAPVDLASHILRGSSKKENRAQFNSFSLWIFSLLIVSALSVLLTLYLSKRDHSEKKAENLSNMVVQNVALHDSTKANKPANSRKSEVKAIAKPTKRLIVKSSQEPFMKRDNKTVKIDLPKINEPALLPSPKIVAEPLKDAKNIKKYSLSGIGWQKDASSRYAVINGAAVGEGGSVDGALVMEIRPDSVKLSREGVDEEIRLGK